MLSPADVLAVDRAPKPVGSYDVDFDEFVRARGQGLCRSAFLLTGDRHLAEDLVQVALAGLRETNPEPPPPPGQKADSGAKATGDGSAVGSCDTSGS
jgi:hypothetical protein